MEATSHCHQLFRTDGYCLQRNRTQYVTHSPITSCLSGPFSLYWLTDRYTRWDNVCHRRWWILCTRSRTRNPVPMRRARHGSFIVHNQYDWFCLSLRQATCNHPRRDLNSHVWTFWALGDPHSHTSFWCKFFQIIIPSGCVPMEFLCRLDENKRRLCLVSVGWENGIGDSECDSTMDEGHVLHKASPYITHSGRICTR